MKTKISLIFISLLFYTISNAQILHTESFSVILDTTKTIKGSVIPDFKFQTQKENLFEFENTADLTFKNKSNIFTVANKIELSKYGDETILSGGFLYMEYRKILEQQFVLEPYSQFHWTEARGLEFKYAGGINFRYRIYVSDKIGVFAGTGPFYEYERWNYDGVMDENLPTNIDDVIQQNIKLGTYLSFKWFTEYNFDFDFSFYHQSRFDEIFSTPRLASSSSITYNFTEFIGLVLKYQNIYDYKPVVPIDKLYKKIILTIEVAF